MKFAHRLGFIVILFFAFLNAQSSPKHYQSFFSTEELQAYLSWSPDKLPIVEAHRGGPMPGFPENCLETFEKALSYAPCLIEIDVQKAKDGVLLLMHDDTLGRTTTGSGLVSDYTSEDLKKLFLRDNFGNITPYRIPTLSEAFQWAKDKAILQLDIKGTIAAEEIVTAIDNHDAEAYTIIITYDLESAQQYHRLNPQLVISASAKGMEGTSRLLNSSIDHDCLVAFVGVYEPPLEVYEALHRHGILAILGVIGNLDQKAKRRGAGVYVKLLKNGADVLATDNVPLVADAVRQYMQEEVPVR
ncbi:MAG: glycerophosphodiester phosphodiesterase [Aliifodinibius sp.]|nr:glycerophosphodiester phosphodiesterase [Fodinibius sp.]